MTDIDVFLPVGAQPSVDALVEQAARAEELGYDRVWLPETWGRDAVTVMTAIASETDAVGVGTSILNTYSRSPATLGQTAATLQEVADGRFRLGLGPSGPIVIENWHGMDYGNPLRRTRETVEVVEAVLSGEEVDYDGEYFDLQGFRLRCEPPEPRPPVDAAAMGPKAVELAGRFADGWHATTFSADGIRERLADLERGAELAGRSVDDLRVTMSVSCCALEDGERARELVVQGSAFYIGGMGTFYRDNLLRQGYDVAEEIHDAWQAGDRERALTLVREELADELGAAGTPEAAREQFRRYREVDGVDAVAVSFPRGAGPAEVESTMEALAP